MDGGGWLKDDTVIDVGMFDGALGIITPIMALKVLNINGMPGKLRWPVEVIAFSDEEGVRFQSTFLGSAAIAGILPASTLQAHDKSGVTVQGALRNNSIEITEEDILQLQYDHESVWGYIEVHIEQGPVVGDCWSSSWFGERHCRADTDEDSCERFTRACRNGPHDHAAGSSGSSC